MPFGMKKTRMVWLRDGKNILKIYLFVLRTCTNVTHTQTDRQKTTPHDDIGRACIASRGKNASMHIKDEYILCCIFRPIQCSNQNVHFSKSKYKTNSVCAVGNNVTKRCVFRRRLKMPSVSDAVTLDAMDGKVF